MGALKQNHEQSQMVWKYVWNNQTNLDWLLLGSKEGGTLRYGPKTSRGVLPGTWVQLGFRCRPTSQPCFVVVVVVVLFCFPFKMEACPKVEKVWPLRLPTSYEPFSLFLDGFMSLCHIFPLLRVSMSFFLYITINENSGPSLRCMWMEPILPPFHCYYKE